VGFNAMLSKYWLEAA